MPLFGSRILCPYCLTEIRSRSIVSKCPACSKEIPVQYARDYDKHAPFFVQVFGWSRVGKTVFLSALTLMLVKMSNLWPRYSYAPANDVSQNRVKDINTFIANGVMPPLTQLGPQEVYIMLLHNMERWGGRTLVTRDCAGEIFDTMNIPKEQAPFLLRAPTTFMVISLPDLPNSGGYMIEMLMNNYINTLLTNKVDFRKNKRQLVVVLSKADMIKDLPPNLRNYLMQDPLWAAVNSRAQVKAMTLLAMEEYIEVMGRVSDFIRDWIQRDASGKVFVRRAEDNNIDLRFTLISSTGGEVDNSNSMNVALAPHRVLDPYFWALELQSLP